LHFFRACYMTRPSHCPSFDHPNNIWWSVKVTKLLIMQSFPLSHHFIPLNSQTPSTYALPSHPYKAAGTIIVLYILIFNFLINSDLSLLPTRGVSLRCYHVYSQSTLYKQSYMYVVILSASVELSALYLITTASIRLTKTLNRCNFIVRVEHFRESIRPWRGKCRLWLV
jgi:hypothetical protein